MTPYRTSNPIRKVGTSGSRAESGEARVAANRLRLGVAVRQEIGTLSEFRNLRDGPAGRLYGLPPSLVNLARRARICRLGTAHTFGRMQIRELLEIREDQRAIGTRKGPPVDADSADLRG